jgi:hypothetical protein
LLLDSLLSIPLKKKIEVMSKNQKFLIYSVQSSLQEIISILKVNQIKHFEYAELGFGSSDCYYIAVEKLSTLPIDWIPTAASYDYFVRGGWHFTEQMT